MYSVMTVGLLLVGFWSDRQRSGFAIAICSMLAAHCAFLFAIRGLFPFRTILTIVPVALMEGAILAILMLKILEHSRANDDI
jgi:predicted MFS family arabinose efflux permease